MEGFCPFCNAPIITLSGPMAKCAGDGHEFQYQDALAEIAPRIPGWVYTNMRSATNLFAGRYIYDPDLCEPERDEESVGADLLEQWGGRDYRRCTVYWEVNCPVPKAVLAKNVQRLEVEMNKAAEQIGILYAQAREYYPNG